VSVVSRIIGTAERVPLPDLVVRAAVQRLCSRTATRLASGNAESDASFAEEMAARAIAEHTDAANAQHYEVPAAFFGRVLGPNRKYSSCFYKEPKSTLQAATPHCGCGAGAGSSSPHQDCSATPTAPNGASVISG
jgi:cyclopropane-fatty-acyl-phospholipid synthase